MAFYGRRLLGAMTVFDVFLEPRKRRGESLHVFTNPAVAHALDRQRIEVIPPRSSFAANDDQLGRDEHVEMLHYCRAADGVEARDELAGRLRTFGQRVENVAPHRIAEGTPHELILLLAASHVT